MERNSKLVMLLPTLGNKLIMKEYSTVLIFNEKKMTVLWWVSLFFCRYKSKLVEVDHDGCRVKVHFEGWNGRYDEWLPMNSKRLRPLTEEIFSEHQESYSVGDFVIARWQAKHTQAGLVVGCLSEKSEAFYFLNHLCVLSDVWVFGS